MDVRIDSLLRELLNPRSLFGATILALLFIGMATAFVLVIRRAERRIAVHLTDTTALRFTSALAQVLASLLAFVLYAHLVPELRALGTALLTGVSVVSVIVGVAAQSTLGNLIAGFSLVLYRPVRIGDQIQLTTPVGLLTARVELVSLGYTVLRDDDQHEVIVPNSVMMGTTLVRVSRAPRGE